MKIGGEEMFGYIKPLEAELKVRQLKLYKAVYCGLCSSAGRRISVFSRFFLSYDYTFFAIVHMLLSKSEYTFTKKRCGFRLFAKTDAVADNPSLALSAAIFSILTYYKLLDNVKDEGFLKSLGARLLLPFASHMRKKAVRAGFSEADFIISDCLEEISVLEKKNDAAADEISDIFGKMLGHLLKLGIPDKEKENAYTVGFETGKFIYLADAYDDLFVDEKSSSFNPYLYEYKSDDIAEKEIYTQIKALLRGTDEAADLLSSQKENMPICSVRLLEIAQNILYLGCPAVLERIHKKHTTK